MDTSALSADVVLPTATSYEKHDLQLADDVLLPINPAVPPSWESRPEWDLFAALAHAVARLGKRRSVAAVDGLAEAFLSVGATPRDVARAIHLDEATTSAATVPRTTFPFLAAGQLFLRVKEAKFTAGSSLARGADAIWLNHHDARDRAIADHDTIEINHAGGTHQARAIVSARVARGTCLAHDFPGSEGPVTVRRMV